MSKIKFLTLNLFEGGFFLDKALKFLHQENPDIMVFQEVYNGENGDLEQNFRTVQILKENFKSYDYHFAAERLDDMNKDKVEWGNAIFSRFPITSSKVVFYAIPYNSSYKKEKMKGDFSLDPHNLQRVTIKIGEKILNVFNTHGIWGLNGLDNLKRLKMSKIIVENIKDCNNVILAGDFNTNPNTQTIHNIEQYLINVFGKKLKTTFNMKRKKNPNYANSVVDMIFISPGIQVVESYCPMVDVSDHLPLLCVLKV